MEKARGTGRPKCFGLKLKIYQITDKGLLLQANWGETKFLKYKDLNEQMKLKECGRIMIVVFLFLRKSR